MATIRCCQISELTCFIFKDDQVSCHAGEIHLPLTQPSKIDLMFSKFQDQIDQWLGRIYDVKDQCEARDDFPTGRLPDLSLCADVFYMMNTQLNVICVEFLTRPEIVGRAARMSFERLMLKQIERRDSFLTDVETCCAISVEYMKMAEQFNVLIERLGKDIQFSLDEYTLIARSAEEAASLFTSDAIYSAQYIDDHIFKTIDDSIGKSLFLQRVGIEYDRKRADPCSCPHSRRLLSRL